MIKIVLLVMLLFISCTYQEKYIPKETDKTDLVVIGTNVINDFSDSIPDIDISGTWISQSSWLQMDSTWKIFKSININKKYIFNPNGVFHFYTIYNDTLVTDYLRGDYKLYPDKEILIIDINDKGDTLFQHGDKIKRRDFQLYSLNDSIMRIRDCLIGSCDDIELIEFRKK